jgi:hypothetical protein
MHPTRFDAFIRSVTRDWSRRGVLRLLAGGAFTGLLTVHDVPRAQAMHFDCHHVRKPCTRSRQCCSGICRGPQGKKTCRAHGTGMCKTGQDSCDLVVDFPCGDNSPNGSCVCFVTTGGASFCGGNEATTTCTKDKECEDSHGPGAACVPCAGDTICVSKCPNPD